MEIKIATTKEKNYLEKKDNLKVKRVIKKIRAKEYIVAKINNKNVGFIRFGYFWSEIPIVEMIRIEEKHKKQGIGKYFIKQIEKIARKNKQKIIMSSSTEGEPGPEKWHKKIGFEKTGKFIPKYLTKTPEIIYIKKVK